MKIKEFKKRFNKITVGDADNKAKLLIEFIMKNGINKIKRKDLDTIIGLYGIEIFHFEVPSITDLHDIVAQRESSKKITRLTLWVFIFGLIITVATLYSVFY